jgi:aspartate kinase
MGVIACKFGGTSLATAAQVRKVAAIIRSDPRRRFVVVSAPGKREKKDTKITDLLYLCHELAHSGLDMHEPFDMISARYRELAAELGARTDVEGAIRGIRERIGAGGTRDWVASRGEWLSGRIIADFLGAAFVEAAEVVKFQHDGRLDERTYELIAAAVAGPGLYVVPGFYGALESGEVKTFPRGGSDITGAIVARAVDAEVYENWTDVPGFLMTDPRVVKNPKPIRTVTYREMRELAYMGAEVLNTEAVLPVYHARIPINIRNTNEPEHPGTIIAYRREATGQVVAGIAGRRNFTMINIEKLLMNREVGFGRKVFEILETHGVSFEHAPTGIDSMSVIVSDDELGDKTEVIVEEIKRVLEPDDVEVQTGLALIATVGEEMPRHAGIAARLFTALAAAGISVRVIDQGSSEINIIVGIEGKDFEPALNAIYQAFCGDH